MDSKKYVFINKIKCSFKNERSIGPLKATSPLSTFITPETTKICNENAPFSFMKSITDFSEMERLGSLVNPPDNASTFRDSRSKCPNSRNHRSRSHSVGLKNSLNSCYINAILQCLFGIREIRTMTALENDNEFIKNLCKMLQQMGSDSVPVNTERFNKKISERTDKFANYKQQDARSFLMFLLKEIQDNKTGNSSFQGLFSGTIETKIKYSCQSKHVDTFRESVYVFPLTTSGQKNLQTCFDTFLQSKEEDTVDWCFQCQSPIEGRVTRELTNLPIYLVMVLNMVTFMTFKKEPLTIRLSETIKLGPRKEQFNLFAICEHHGLSISSGHYTARVKDLNDDNVWYSYNDDRMTKTSFSTLNENAYILFYKKQSIKEHHYSTANDVQLASGQHLNNPSQNPSNSTKCFKSHGPTSRVRSHSLRRTHSRV